MPTVIKLLALAALGLCACFPQALLAQTATGTPFKSGFESSTALGSAPGNGPGGFFQPITGTDTFTGYAWPFHGWGASTFGIHLIPASGNTDSYASHFLNSIETVTGHTGASTKALHMHIQGYPVGSCCAQQTIEQNGFAQGVKNLYQRFWLKVPSGLAADFASNHNDFDLFWGWKTNNHARSDAIITNGGGTPHWELQHDTRGRNCDGGGSTGGYIDPNTGATFFDCSPFIYSDATQTATAVPLDTWFLVEIYMKRSIGNDGFEYFAVNGQTLSFMTGPNYGYQNEEIANGYWLEEYGAALLDEWVDDIEWRDSLPPGCSAFPCGASETGSGTQTSSTPHITSPEGAIGVAGQSFSYQTVASGATSFSASGLPSGLSINSSTGLISGTPPGSGRFAGINATAHNSNGSEYRQLVFQINSAPSVAPTISSFAASPASINAGDWSALQWAQSGARTLTINGVNVNGQDPYPVNPLVTTTYVLTATNAIGSVTRNVTVSVSGTTGPPPTPLPIISSFTASPGTITGGGTSTLAWNTSGATTVSINQGIGAVANPSGSTSVTPSATTIYTVTATNSAGSAVTQQATVTVAASTVGTYYISQSGGNDGFDGLSPDRPWQTINKVNGHSFSSDNRILFKSGDTWRGTTLVPSSSGTSGHAIIYGTYGTGAKPILDGGGSLSYLIRDSQDFTTFQGLQLQNTSSALVNFTGTNGTQFLNITGRNGGLRGFYGGFLTGTTVVDHLNYSDDSSHTTSSNIVEVWQNCTGSSVTVTNSVFDRSLSPGIVGGLSVAVNGGCNGTYRYNVVHGGGQGIGVKPYHDSSGNICPAGSPATDNNNISDNYIDGVSRYGQAGGAGETNIDGELIEMEGCPASGSRQTNTTIARNVLICKTDSRLHWGSSDAIGGYYTTGADIFGNVILGACQNGTDTDSPGAMRLNQTSVNMKVYNNTLVGTHPDSRHYHAIGFFPGSTGGLVKNNIISNYNIGILAADSSTGLTEDYNIFDTNVPNPTSGSGSITHGGHSQTNTDPQFAFTPVASANDVKLQGTSPAIGFGATLGSTWEVILGMGGTSAPYPLFTQSVPWADGAFGYGAGTGGGPPGSPTISSFSASPTTVTSGSPSTLSWVTSDATTLEINNGIGPVTGDSSSISVSPSATTTYTLTATNANGSTTATATVTVAVPVAPVIESFTATPSSIPSDHYTELQWVVDGADTLTLDPGGIDVTPFNMWLVRLRSDTTFTLTATNSVGTVTATVPVDVFTPTGPAAENIRYHQIRQYDRRGDAHEFQMYRGWPEPKLNYPSLYDEKGNVFPAQPRGDTDKVQMAKGPFIPGNALVTDADGNAIDGGSPPGAGANGCGTWYQEVPSGVLDGVNTSFALTFQPSSPFLIVALNGVVENPFAPFSEYTLIGTTVGMAEAPKSTDSLFVSYFACVDIPQPPPPTPNICDAPAVTTLAGSGGVPHAYWSINVTMVNGGGDIDGSLESDVVELDFYATVEGSDVATGGTPLGSAGLFGGNPPFAFDDNLSTGWAGLGHTPFTGTPPRLGYHFLAPVGITAFAITSDPNLHWGNFSPSDMTLDWSDDGSTWTPGWRFVVGPDCWREANQTMLFRTGVN